MYVLDKGILKLVFMHWLVSKAKKFEHVPGNSTFEILTQKRLNASL